MWLHSNISKFISAKFLALGKQCYFEISWEPWVHAWLVGKGFQPGVFGWHSSHCYVTSFHTPCIVEKVVCFAFQIFHKFRFEGTKPKGFVLMLRFSCWCCKPFMASILHWISWCAEGFTMVCTYPHIYIYIYIFKDTFMCFRHLSEHHSVPLLVLLEQPCLQSGFLRTSCRTSMIEPVNAQRCLHLLNFFKGAGKFLGCAYCKSSLGFQKKNWLQFCLCLLLGCVVGISNFTNQSMWGRTPGVLPQPGLWWALCAPACGFSGHALPTTAK